MNKELIKLAASFVVRNEMKKQATLDPAVLQGISDIVSELTPYAHVIGNEGVLALNELLMRQAPELASAAPAAGLIPLTGGLL